MRILKEAENTMAFFKCGIFGFQGAGKTYTASQLATGICKKIGIKEIAYFDTETGSDFMLPKLKNEGFKVYQVKSRAFGDLIKTVQDCEEGEIFLIIDSITHVWRDLMQSYDKKLNRRGRLQFQDWAIIKGEWQVYTDLFVNSNIHIIVAGRAGYEYDYEHNQDGTKDLIKTGTKMKTEAEFGFEPSLVIEIERLSQNRKDLESITDRRAKQSFQPKKGSISIHRAHILKDRSDTINGKMFEYHHDSEKTIYDDIAPHFEFLNIGGVHVGVDTSRTSEDRFDIEGRPDWKKRQVEKDIALDEIQQWMVKMWPSSKAEDKKSKGDFIEAVFGKRTWVYVQEKVAVEKLQEVVYALPLMEQKYSQSDDVPIDVIWCEVLAMAEKEKNDKEDWYKVVAMAEKEGGDKEDIEI